MEGGVFTLLEKIIKKAVHNNLFPGCVTEFFKGKETTYSSVVGDARKDLLYDIASITKVLVSLGTLRLVALQKLSLDTKVSSIIPFENTGGIQDMAIWHLLTYTVDFDLPEDLKTQGIHLRNALGEFRFFKEAGLVGIAGSRFRYGNPHAFVQGKVIECLTGKSLPDALKELVFEPLGLTQTTFNPDLSRVAPTHLVDGSGWQYGIVQDPMSQKFLPEKVGVAGIFSTIDDMVKLVWFLATGFGPHGQVFLSHWLWRWMITNQLKDSKLENGSHRYGLGIDMPDEGYVSDQEFCRKAVFMSGASGPFIFACSSWSGGKTRSYPIGGVILSNTRRDIPDAKEQGRIFRRAMVQAFLEGMML